MAAGRKWTDEERRVVLDLYNELEFGQFHARHPRVQEVATLIDRSANSVAMKLCNFAALDPNLDRVGLISYSKDDESFWNRKR